MFALLLSVGVLLTLSASLRLTGVVLDTRRRRGSARDARSSLPTETEPRTPLQQGWTGWRSLAVVQIEDASADCRSYELGDPSGGPLPDYEPGQFIVVRLTGRTGKLVQRCYSLSDRPNGRTYRITVKRVTGGEASEWMHESLKPGSLVGVLSARGNFVPPWDPEIPLNLVAAGVGITPMASIVRFCQRWQPQRPIRLFYQFRDLSSAPLLREVIETLSVMPHASLLLYPSRWEGAAPGWAAGIGRLTAREIIARCRQLEGREGRAFDGAEGSERSLAGGPLLLCGPPEMLDSMRNDLIALGVQAADVYLESFAGRSQPRLDESPTESTSVRCPQSYRIEFARAGIRGFSDEGKETILEMAESLGVPLDSGCRSGQCGTCIVRLLEGKVDYPAPLDTSALAPGEIFSCLARPLEDLRVDA